MLVEKKDRSRPSAFCLWLDRRAEATSDVTSGMTAQDIAIAFPERVRSLISIMSTTGDPACPSRATRPSS